jgi:lysyl-tRNA synthetase class 2
MLEWYTVGADYMESIRITEELFDHLRSGMFAELRRRFGDRQIEYIAPFLRLSMAEAFRSVLGMDLRSTLESGFRALARAAAALGLPVSDDDSPQDLFQKIFLSAVEPELPAQRPLILYDYPALVPTLARSVSGTPWAERWELYLAGVEVANCYSEETDPGAYEDFYAGEEPAKQQAAVPHPADRELVRIIRETGFPASSGVAMGLERLLQFFLGQDSIRGVLPFGTFVPPGEDAQD